MKISIEEEVTLEGIFHLEIDIIYYYYYSTCIIIFL